MFFLRVVKYSETAMKYAEQSGDKSLTTKVDTVKKAVETIREDIKRQMNPKEG